MQARMANPGALMPKAMEALIALGVAVKESPLPQGVFELVHLRVSQLNGCSVCVDGGAQVLRKAGESDERIFTVAAWRDAPYFTDAERAALALAEAMTRLSDRENPVPDEVWNKAATHFDEATLAALVIAISVTNVWNRLNVATRQIAGVWKP